MAAADRDKIFNEKLYLEDEEFSNESELLHEKNRNSSINPELETFMARIQMDLEEEAEKLKQIESEFYLPTKINTPNFNDISIISSPSSNNNELLLFEKKQEVDSRSIFVGNVHYNTTAQDLEDYFQCCGQINRVTILTNKLDGHPKGFAYIEFVLKVSVEVALSLNETIFRGRKIKVMTKRTNIPGLSNSNRYLQGCHGGRVLPEGVYRSIRNPIRETSTRLNYFTPY